MKRTIPASAFALTATLVLTPAGAAQEAGPWTLDARGGVSIPAGELADLQSFGGTVAAGISRDVHPRVALGVDGSVDFLSGKDTSDEGILLPVPDMTVWNYRATIDILLTDPASPWDLTVDLGIGGSTLDTDEVAVGQQAGAEFKETYLATSGGVTLGVDVGTNARLFVSGRSRLAYADEDDTLGFADFSSEVDPDGFDSVWTFPVQLGISFTL